jgi:hypothetical protein
VTTRFARRYSACTAPISGVSASSRTTRQRRLNPDPGDGSRWLPGCRVVPRARTSGHSSKERRELESPSACRTDCRLTGRLSVQQPAVRRRRRTGRRFMTFRRNSDGWREGGNVFATSHRDGIPTSQRRQSLSRNSQQNQCSHVICTNIARMRPPASSGRDRRGRTHGA